MKKILIVFGTRPEAIKMAPLILELKKFPKKFDVIVCVTGQHLEMLDQVLEFFQITPDYNLNVMNPGQSLTELTSTLLRSVDSILNKTNPDYVFVHGDTTSAMASALAGFYYGCKIFHVEAGLRTHNIGSPFPEEMNRQVISKLTSYHFAPTSSSKSNLLSEFIDADNILVTGNTVIDALKFGLKLLPYFNSPMLSELKKELENTENFILVTGHRRENLGDGFINICKSIKKIAESNPDLKIVFPVHLNPKVQDPVRKYLADVKNIILTKPAPYSEFIWLMSHCSLILTDSGGVQEEGPSLGKPVLVMRDTTERPEALEAGTVKLVGTDQNEIYQTCTELLKRGELYNKMSRAINPYGDGKACERIVKFLEDIE